MAKLTKQQSKAHRTACELLKKATLTLDEKIFVLENWHEGGEHDQGRAGAFFTPIDYANDFKLDVHGPKVLDLCAGIGSLAFAWLHFKDHQTPVEITCVEINPAYVEVGRKILPEANWICGDVFEIWQDLPRDFETVISNPPFGRIQTNGKAPRYTGPEFELKIVDIAAHLGRFGTFILPQGSSGFRYSGARYFERVETPKTAQLFAETGLELDIGCGVDTTFFSDQWKQPVPVTEIACVEFPEIPDVAPALPVAEPMMEAAQLLLFPAYSGDVVARY